MMVIETAFSTREQELARRSLHLSPSALAEELACLAKGRDFPIYITHTKPAEAELIMAEILDFERSSAAATGKALDIRWLLAGQEFEL